MGHTFDLRILLYLNSTAPPNSWGATFWDFVGQNPLCRGFPIFFSVVVLWFSNDSIERRSRMLLGLLGTCAAVLLSVWLQHHLNVHTRPFLDPSLHLQSTPPAWSVGLEHLNSFPSDTATLFFSLATVILLENRIAGGVAFLWASIAAGAARVATGWHYPSDILGALLLGPSCVLLITRARPIQAFFARLLERSGQRIYIVHAILFLFLADAYVLLEGIQNSYVILGKISAYIVKQL